MKHLSAKKEWCFLELFQAFIAESRTGKRLQPNGKRISKGTIGNYENVLKLLWAFSAERKFPLRIKSVQRLTVRQIEGEKGYWKKFYRKFSDYLYEDLGCFDNYAGQCFKIIKTFFAYLSREKGLMTGDLSKQLYVRKEEVAIFTLLPEELNYFIYDRDFEDALPARLCEAKDVFVFGCTVGLRVSDLLTLTKANVRVINEVHYLAVRSRKTSVDSLIKLPSYAVAIIDKYRKHKRLLLPHFNASNLNQYIKQLTEKAGMTREVYVSRERRGVAVKQCNGGRALRFCDVVSTHTMRRTAITTMLCLGMPEQLVRKISGHAPNSKEFYRYVLWAQAYQDQESEKVFERLREKQLRVA